MSEDKPMSCPACTGFSMRKFSSMDVGMIIDRCTKCKGLWFDVGEISQFLQSEQLKENFLEPAEPDAIINDSGARKCPRCLKVMKQPVVGGVRVDICDACSGVWLDHGELNTLVDLYQKQGLEGDDSLVEEIRRGLEEEPVTESVLKQLAGAMKELVAKVRPPATPEGSSNKEEG